MENYFSSMLESQHERAVEASLSVLGIQNPSLRTVLRDSLSSEPGNAYSIIADPVFEQMFSWEKADCTMESLSGARFDPKVIDALHSPPKKHKDTAFEKHWHPYEHQLKAWDVLKPGSTQSLVVTTGTGSGKTECFMVPILDDLVRERDALGADLEGVRALFLYPLNALIASQQDRLSAWTSPFGKGVRFALYNGNLPPKERETKAIKAIQNQIMDRRRLYESPPPILVTNATMLEYMLVRQKDEPIRRTSKGKLRWIVLDEAHSYTGSQAAEMALLLRRVLATFEVQPENVRFVATSATIGDAESQEKLREFIADLAGVNASQVEVISGKRQVPSLPTVNVPVPQSYDEIAALDRGEMLSDSRFQALVANPISKRLRRLVAYGKPGADKKSEKLVFTLSEITEELRKVDERIDGSQVLKWLDLCTRTAPAKSRDSQAFLRVRGHFFHDVVSGIWSCVNQNCAKKSSTPLAENWPFGMVYTRHRKSCECEAPVFELGFCGACNEPHLLAVDGESSLDNGNARLMQREWHHADDFVLAEHDESAEDEGGEPALTPHNANRNVVIQSPKNLDGARHKISFRDGDFCAADIPHIEVTYDDDIGGQSQCWRCDSKGRNDRSFIRSLRLGAPFYISNMVPTVLEYCPKYGMEKNQNPDRIDLPANGKRLITFTDSRQGSARLTVKMQQEAERNRIRALVYSKLIGSLRQPDTEYIKEQITQKTKMLKLCESSGLNDSEMVELLNKEISDLESLCALSVEAPEIGWQDLVSRLETETDVKDFIWKTYRNYDVQLFEKPRDVIQLLLLSEFARRPKRQNSLESLGLVTVGYKGLETLKMPPPEWGLTNSGEAGWQSFLKLCLDFYVRENTFLDLSDDILGWMGKRVFAKELLAPNSSVDDSGTSKVKKWPQIKNPKRPQKLFKILAEQANLSYGNKAHIDQANKILTAAWEQLTRKTNLFTQKGDGKVALNIDFLTFKITSKAWVCPLTNRLIDNTFGGLSPYLTSHKKSDPRCELVDIPFLMLADSDIDLVLDDRVKAIRNWCKSNTEIAELRERNLWTDLSDRIVEGGAYFLAAEHSAQQSHKRLDDLTRNFKSGSLNVLNCSTTMEMGVDIGGISAVVMNNVPPHPANYLQRAGRAGRGNEARAVAFTLCKDNPHEQQVRSNTLWPFTTKLPVPNITLDSERIVQRHVNSVFIGDFLCNEASDRAETLTVTCGSFYLSEPDEPSVCESFETWLAQQEQASFGASSKAIPMLVKNTALAPVAVEKLARRCREHCEALREKWLAEYRQLELELSGVSQKAGDQSYKMRIERDISRLTGEYLLSELATRTFLPGYGFPTGVVTFNFENITSFKRRKNRHEADSGPKNESRTKSRDLPSRNLGIAIREYAPGNEIVLDGLAYQSAGLALDWHNSNPDHAENQNIRKAWRCDGCGHTDTSLSALAPDACPSCGKAIKPSETREYIEPAGFSVDFFGDPPTNIMSSPQYIPVKPSWVISRGEFVPLPGSSTGEFRVSIDGEIFQHSSGLHGHGYAVCLSCGRADSMLDVNHPPKNLQHGKAHSKLRGAENISKDYNCKGPDSPNGIKTDLHIGYKMRTDIFTLHLKREINGEYLRFDNETDRTAATSIVVAMRDALAGLLGVNSDELGYSVTPVRVEDAGDAIAALHLYDTSAGGCGFASSAPRYLTELFKKTKENLECVAECDDACQSCLLSHNTRFDIDRLHRKKALEVISGKFLHRLELQEPHKVLGAESRYCPSTITETIRHYSNRGLQRIKIWLDGEPAEWDFGAAELRQQITAATGEVSLDKVELIIPDCELPEQLRQNLIGFMYQGASITQSGVVVLSQPGALIAVVENKDGKKTAFATHEKQTTIVDERFWSLFGDHATVVSGSAPQMANNQQQLVIDNLLHQNLEGGSKPKKVEVLRQCNGSIILFGKKFWDHLAANDDEITYNIKSGKSVVSVHYSDRYIRSPLTAILCSVWLSRLMKLANSQAIAPTLKITTAYNRHNKNEGFRRPGNIAADWQDAEVQQEVIRALFAADGYNATVECLTTNETQHGRCLSVVWDDGSTSEAWLDQGMGYWKHKSSAASYFDHSASIDEQVKSLCAIAKSPEHQVVNRFDFETPVFIFHFAK